MSKRKILFVDLDDTLLSSDKTISQKNLDAIRAMTEKGHGFVICTGRPLYSSLVLARQYGFLGENYYIASYNGGQIIDTSSMKEIYHEGITEDVVEYLFKKAHEWGLYVQTYNDDMILVDEDSDYIRWYSERIRMPYSVVDNVIDALEKPPLKCIVAHMDDHERLERFKHEIGDELKDVTNTIFSNPVLLEFGSRFASKGIAVIKLCELLGIDIADSVAAGDEGNDVAMLESAGIGVAMINGVDAAKAAADVITERDNNHDAIDEIIYKYILGSAK